MYYDQIHNKSYLLGYKTYDGDNKELKDIKSLKYSWKFDRFIFYEAKIEREDLYQYLPLILIIVFNEELIKNGAFAINSRQG